MFPLSINNNNNNNSGHHPNPNPNHMMSSLIEPPPNWIGPRHHPFPCAGCGRPHLPLPPFHRPTTLRLKPTFLAHHGAPLKPAFLLFGRRLFPFPTRLGGDKGRVRANSSCEQDRDSGEKREAKGGGESKPPAANPPNRGKGWRGKKGGLQWRPLIQAQEVGVLLLQLGLVMTAMRFLRPAIPLPGADPRPQTTYVSVPYSDFLSRINGNQVQKVEVDGVHIMFRLRSEIAAAAVAAAPGKGECEAGRLQEAESLMRSVAPTKRIVYTTTRPSDIKAPYEKMLENAVEFGSPDKRSGGFLNSGLVRFSLYNLS